MTIKVRYRRLMSSILSIILCITILGGMTIQSVYCAPFVIPLSSLAPIVAKVLITAGVSFISYEALNGASRECIEGMSEALAQELRSMAADINNGVVNVTSNVWSYCKSWVDSHFNTGENSYDITTDTGYTAGSFISTSSEFIVSYNNFLHVLQWKEAVDGKAVLYQDGVPLTNSAVISAVDWDKFEAMEICINGTSKYIYFFMRYWRPDLNTYVDYSQSAMASPYKYYVDSVSSYRGITSHAVSGADNVIDNPDYIHGNDITGENSFVVSQPYADLLTKTPEAITDADVKTEIETYVGLTCDDVKAETIPEAPDVPDTNTGILQGILDSLTGTITSKITAINDAITGIIARLLGQIKDNTQEEELNSNGIFEFFISLLLILKHLVLIVIKFLALLVLMRTIPAQSFLFDPNTKAVIDYIHQHELPMFNISFMSIINAFIGILVIANIIRLINKNVRINL